MIRFDSPFFETVVLKQQLFPDVFGGYLADRIPKTGDVMPN